LDSPGFDSYNAVRHLAAIIDTSARESAVFPRDKILGGLAEKIIEHPLIFCSIWRFLFGALLFGAFFIRHIINLQCLKS
jgi:hypothetical protein